MDCHVSSLLLLLGSALGCFGDLSLHPTNEGKRGFEQKPGVLEVPCIPRRATWSTGFLFKVVRRGPRGWFSLIPEGFAPVPLYLERGRRSDDKRVGRSEWVLRFSRGWRKGAAALSPVFLERCHLFGEAKFKAEGAFEEVSAPVRREDDILAVSDSDPP